MADKKDKQTFNTKVYECCGDDKLRPLYQCVHFDSGYAYATDGHIVIKQTLSFQSILDPEELDGKSLNKDSFKAIMAFDIAQANPDGIECWNENGQKVFFEYYTLKEDEKIPDFESYLARKKGLTGLTFIGINPKLLMRINNALYVPDNHTVRMQFTGVDTAIIIDVPGVDEQIAVLMPAIINGTLF